MLSANIVQKKLWALGLTLKLLKVNTWPADLRTWELFMSAVSNVTMLQCVSVSVSLPSIPDFPSQGLSV